MKTLMKGKKSDKSMHRSDFFSLGELYSLNSTYILDLFLPHGGKSPQQLGPSILING